MANITTIDELKSTIARQHMKTLNNFFANDEKKTNKFLSAVAYCSQSTPKILECSQESIISAFMKCAEYNLFPSSVSGEVYILPYEKKSKNSRWDWVVTEVNAQFQLGYKGIIALLSRTWVSIYTDIVKKNDTCKITSGMNQNIFHEYPLTARWEAIGVYVIATVDGEKTIKYMAKDEVLEFKKFSKSANSSSSPWDPKNDPELNMWRKTIIKQIAKNLPLTEEAYKAIAIDNEESDIKEYQKNQLVEQAKRPSVSVESLLIPSQSNQWTAQSVTTSNNEVSSGTTSDPELSPEQDSNLSSEKSELSETKHSEAKTSE